VKVRSLYLTRDYNYYHLTLSLYHILSTKKRSIYLMINLYVIRPSQNACVSNWKRKLLTGEREEENCIFSFCVLLSFSKINWWKDVSTLILTKLQIHVNIERINSRKIWNKHLIYHKMRIGTSLLIYIYILRFSSHFALNRSFSVTNISHGEFLSFLNHTENNHCRSTLRSTVFIRNVSIH